MSNLPSEPEFEQAYKGKLTCPSTLHCRSHVILRKRSFNQLSRAFEASWHTINSHALLMNRSVD